MWRADDEVAVCMYVCVCVCVFACVCTCVRVSDSKARAAAAAVVKIAAEVTGVGGGGATVHMRRFVPRCRGSPVARTGNAAASKYRHTAGPARLACIIRAAAAAARLRRCYVYTRDRARAHTPPVALLSCTGATSVSVGGWSGGAEQGQGGRARLRGARHCRCTAAGKTNICPSGPLSAAAVQPDGVVGRRLSPLRY